MKRREGKVGLPFTRASSGVIVAHYEMTRGWNELKRLGLTSHTFESHLDSNVVLRRRSKWDEYRLDGPRGMMKAYLLDSLCTIDGDLVVGLVSALHPQVVVLDVQL
jgi:hypothetical protein